MKYLKYFILLSVLILLASCKDDSNLITEPSELNKENSFGEQLEKVNRYAEFEIVLENLTPATGPGASQPLSPPVMASHTPRFHVFRLGKYASTELGQLAEDAVNPPMIEMLNESIFAYDVVEGTTGPIFPGEYAKFYVKAKLPFKKFSLVSMLVNTNDAFTGVDAVNLPLHGSREYYLMAYDAGTEINTELKANIPGSCCGSPLVRVPSHDRIKYHNGIIGGGDLDPAIYDWNKKVAKLTITRIN